MLKYKKTVVTEGESYKYKIEKYNNPLTYSNFLFLLQKDAAFRQFYVNLLKDINFHAYHWETPPISVSTQSQPFEFVVTKSPGIDIPPAPGPFRKYFGGETSKNGIAVFDNLGGDARLITPEPDGERNYSHIGVFTQNAPFERQSHLWKRVGEVVADNISDTKLWLNTAGGGVAWLHVRLDSRPKYYKHRPYKS